MSDILEEAEEQYNRPGRGFDYHRRRVFLQLTAEVERLRSELNPFHDSPQIAELKTKIDSLTKERDEIVNTNNKLAHENENRLKEIKDLTAQLAEAETEVEKLEHYIKERMY